MNLYQCQKKAKDMGFDTLEFTADFPTGEKKCKWIDAHMSIFQIEGLDGFLTTVQIDEMFPDLICTPIEA